MLRGPGGETDYLDQFNEHADVAAAHVDRYRALGEMSAAEIDDRVRIDDEPALAAFETLSVELDAAEATRHGAVNAEVSSARNQLFVLFPLGVATLFSGTMLAFRQIGKAERKRAQAEAELKTVARTDGLTGLVNRAEFERVLDRALARHDRDGRPGALLYLDLDGFKRGQRPPRPPRRRRSDTAREVAERTLATLARPYRILDHNISLDASCGVAYYPDDSTDPGTLLLYADTAMYAAKRHGRGLIERYRPETSSPVGSSSEPDVEA